jgi:hypothetical protein
MYLVRLSHGLRRIWRKIYGRTFVETQAISPGHIASLVVVAADERGEAGDGTVHQVK